MAAPASSGSRTMRYQPLAGAAVFGVDVVLHAVGLAHLPLEGLHVVAGAAGRQHRLDLVTAPSSAQIVLAPAEHVLAVDRQHDREAQAALVRAVQPVLVGLLVGGQLAAGPGAEAGVAVLAVAGQPGQPAGDVAVEERLAAVVARLHLGGDGRQRLSRAGRRPRPRPPTRRSRGSPSGAGADPRTPRAALEDEARPPRPEVARPAARLTQRCQAPPSGRAPPRTPSPRSGRGGRRASPSRCGGRSGRRWPRRRRRARCAGAPRTTAARRACSRPWRADPSARAASSGRGAGRERPAAAGRGARVAGRGRRQRPIEGSGVAARRRRMGLPQAPAGPR